MFTSSTKREIRHFHVVVVRWRRRNVQKSAMHVQYCYFANLNLLPFCRSRCSRRWLNSLKRPLTRLKSKLWWRWLLSSVFYMHITCSSSTLLFQIEEEMQNLVYTYRNLATMVTEFGQSYEGRTIRAIKVFYEGVAISLESLKKGGIKKLSKQHLTREFSLTKWIAHFRVPKNLTLKTRPSAKPLLWKWVLFAS